MFQNEDELIAWLRRRAGRKVPGLRLGIGDDAALVEPGRGRELVVTSDLTIEQVHFSRRLHPADSVGHRALARSLSDVAAMGGTPRFALISLGLSRSASREWVEQFYSGVLRLARRFGVGLLGGDTAATPGGIVADVTVIGEVTRSQALLRSGARNGDAIYVAGRLGVSALGLRACQSKSRARHGTAKAISTHLYPEPQCALGRYLAARRLASAAIDTSDGLSTDLTRLLRASHAGGQIREESIPKPISGTSGDDALALALHGGEDYRLLFTVPAAKVHLIPASFDGVRLYRIGTVCAARRGITIIGQHGARPLEPQGYDHFRQR